MKRYPEYKVSDAEWVGEIPVHWKMKRAKFIFRRLQRPVRKSDEIITAFRDGIVTLRKNRRTLGFTNSLKEIGYQGLRKGDLVIHAMDGHAGAIGVSDSDGKSSPVYSVCRTISQENVYYYAYLLRYMALSGFIESLTRGVRERSTEFRFNEFKEIDLLIPPISEQTQIANFLDQKTGQINELLRIKERRIELLQEQRTALINQAVTKGLDPNVEMKPSGVEWIGEVPRHWTLTRLKYISNIPVTYGLNIEADRYRTEGIRLIRITDIDENGSLRQKGVYLSENYVPQEQMLNSYDLLLSRSGATVGKSYLHLQKEKYTSAGYLVRFNFGDYCTSKFIYYITLSHFYRNWLEQQIIISTIQNVNGEKYSNFQLPIPSRQERKQIVASLDRKTTQIDELISTEQRKIELLKEYRQSLISEAVTGKIDVRNEV